MDKSEAKKLTTRISFVIAIMFILWRGYEAANGRGNALLSGVVAAASYTISYLIVGAYFVVVKQVNIFTKD